jgi:long-chain acyl-CoA synthetase
MAMCTGSAPIDLNVLAFLKICFCCPVFEGYGLTETSGITTITEANDPIAGHVGGPVKIAKLRLRDVPEMNYYSTDKPYPRGEVQMKGVNITSGYYKREDKNSEAFDNEGWFCSGDVGMIYPNGSLKIIDRAKNIFKLSQGEYIAPEKLENVYILIPLIGQIMICGASIRNCIVAVIVIDEVEVKKWAVAHNKPENAAALCQDPDLKKDLLDQMVASAKVNKLTGLEKPLDLFLTTEAFSVENNLLTPTFKLKRNIARTYYETQINEMYEELAKKGK